MNDNDDLDRSYENKRDAELYRDARLWRQHARALWAADVLDKWQELNPDAHAFATCYLPDFPIPARKWKCVSFSHPGMFFGPDARAARIAAAEALVAEDQSLGEGL